MPPPLGEADTRAKLIDPAIHRRGWTEDRIKREQTAGAIDIIDGQPRRRSRGRVDYLLRVRLGRDTQPVAVAVLEAKAEHLPPGHGLEQAKGYADARRLNVPFVFSSNGHLFVEFDATAGTTSDPRPLTDFPTPGDLRARYEAAKGFSLDDPAAAPLLARYPGGEATRRYYQDAAIRAVFEKIARCERDGEPKRALLSMATGAGKTNIATWMLRRLSDAGQLRRGLFLCDRDELRQQSLAKLDEFFRSDAAEVFRKPDGTNNAANARVHVATYQTLGVASDEIPGETAAEDASFLAEMYPPGHFSHIVIDECHRSAWGRWSQILTRNPDAVQIGLTATPRQIKGDLPGADADRAITANNYAHFGEPVYEYTLAQAIDDGYLAACQIQLGRVDLDDTGVTLDQVMALGPTDATTGRRITREQLKALYARNDYETILQLPDRVDAMCRDLFNFLLETGGPEQKTIVFCARDRHADAVAAKLGNLYADWCAANAVEPRPAYAFKCTAAGGSDHLADLRGAARSHFVACTVDLLTTGVDVPSVRNIVFFKYVNSPISFYQMVGRGTRLDVATNKLMFHVYDYTNATRLFTEDFVTPAATPKNPAGGGGPPEPAPPVITVEGFDVRVTDGGQLIVTNVDGRAVPITVEAYRQRLAARVTSAAPTLDAFRAAWVDPAARRALMADLPEQGRSALLVRELSGMEPYDLFDVLGDLAYGLSPLTRAYRAGAFSYKHAAWLASLPARPRGVIGALVNQFALAGTDGLENREVFRTPEVVKAGGLAALKEVGEPFAVLREAKALVFSV